MVPRIVGVIPAVTRRLMIFLMQGMGLRKETMADHKQPVRIGLYPGTFDPVTNGHLDVIARAARLLDKLIVGVAINTGKGPMFSLQEREEMVQAEIASIANKNGMSIEVMPFEGLLIDFARKVGASMIVRGLRAVTDFDFEFQMAGMNYRMAPDVETVFLMASERHQFIASRLVKEVAILGGDITSFVPPLTFERVMQRVRENQV
jgi:pantetheine-phosphate adenylyltransferase